MTRVAFVVNGEPHSAMGHRALAFAARLRDRFELQVLFRSGNKLGAFAKLVAHLGRFQPRVCYVLDIAYSGVGAAGLHKHLTRSRLIVDTGDAITELARALDRGRLGLHMTRKLENYALSTADRVVVRGTFHRQLLQRSGVDAVVIPDGVEADQFAPQNVDQLRQQYCVNGNLTIGLVGSSIWSARLKTCYGWDLVEVIRLLRDQPVTGILIGGGSGIEVLKERCRQYGIADRVHFLGPLPYEQLPRYLGLIDVCLSTQSNDLVGQVRTTGKLPLYLAGGKYVLASRVGEASLVLPEEMLVEFEGTVDEGYPQRLAQRVMRLLQDRTLLGATCNQIALAKRRFDYAVLAGQVRGVIESLC